MEPPELRQRIGIGSRHSENDPVKQDHQIDLGSSDSRSTRLKLGQRSELATSFTYRLIVVFVCASFLFVKYMDNRLPRPLTEKDGESEPGSFIEERARRDLQKLTEYGPRVTGSYEADVITIRLFRNLLAEIQGNMSSVHHLEYEVQRPSGAFIRGKTSTYSKVWDE